MPKTSSVDLTVFIEKFNQFNFAEHEVFHWSPKNNTIYYNLTEIAKESGIHQLLHELGHAICNHTGYGSGIELLKIEAEAWAKAEELAPEYGITIDQDKIEQCLDSYRDWLHARSTCPHCQSVSIETNNNQYHCFSCMQKWNVPADQRSRNYRLKTTRPFSIA